MPGDVPSLVVATAGLLGEQSWRGSMAWAALLATTALVVARRPDRWAVAVAAAAREVALVAALLAVWRLVGRVVRMRVDGGMDHGRLVWDVEQWLRLPSEAWVQGWVLPHPELVRGLNVYYMSLHFTSMAVFLAWMWWRRREQYSSARTLVAVSTLLCLTVQVVPVAPPRMFPDLGFVDTALVYGQSVYGYGGSGVGSQLAAVPSVHVAWAAILAWFAVLVMTGWLRWIVLGHAALTVFVVVATANHWWLDGAAAVLIVALVAALQAAWRRRVAMGSATTVAPTAREVTTDVVSRSSGP